MTTNAFRPPKLTELSEHETITSYAKWQSNILFHLSQINEFAPFLETEWREKGVAQRGLADDAAPIPDAQRKTAAQKKIVLERMLGLIAQYAPSLLHNQIKDKSTSLSWIWKRIRQHYGFSQSEIHFLNLHTIKKSPDERHETFYQRIVSHLEDNLLTTTSNLQHDGANVTVDEVMSPTTERLAVYIWLSLTDIRLPAYVQRVYAHDLQTKTVKDIQPILSQSMDTILADLAVQDDIQIQYTRSSFNNYNNRMNNSSNRNNNRGNSSRSQSTPGRTTNKSCSLCKAAGRSHQGHDIGTCWHLSKAEKLQIASSGSW